MIHVAPNLVPDAVLGFNFLIKRTRDKLRRRTFQNVKECFNCEHKFSYVSLPNANEGLGLVSVSEFQLNVSYSTTIEQDGRDIIVSAQTTDALTPVRKKSQRTLLRNGDRIKIDE